MNYYLVTKISEAIETQKCMNLGKHCSQWKRPCTRDYPHAIPSTGTVQNWQISKSWEATGWLSRARLREWKQNVGDCWWICDTWFFFTPKTDTGHGCTARGIYENPANRAAELVVFMVCQLHLNKDNSNKGVPCLPVSGPCPSCQSLFLLCH